MRQIVGKYRPGKYRVIRETSILGEVYWYVQKRALWFFWIYEFGTPDAGRAFAYHAAIEKGKKKEQSVAI